MNLSSVGAIVRVVLRDYNALPLNIRRNVSHPRKYDHLYRV